MLSKNTFHFSNYHTPKATFIISYRRRRDAGDIFTHTHGLSLHHHYAAFFSLESLYRQLIPPIDGGRALPRHTRYRR